MVGILFEVASNRIQIDLVEEMLNGKIEKWPQNAKMATPYGLYLTKVEYWEEAMENSTENVEKLPILPQVENPILWKDARQELKDEMRNIFKMNS